MILKNHWTLGTILPGRFSPNLHLHWWNFIHQYYNLSGFLSPPTRLLTVTMIPISIARSFISGKTCLKQVLLQKWTTGDLGFGSVRFPRGMIRIRFLSIQLEKRHWTKYTSLALFLSLSLSLIYNFFSLGFFLWNFLCLKFKPFPIISFLIDFFLYIFINCKIY